jgi:hypothetical protein
MRRVSSSGMFAQLASSLAIAYSFLLVAGCSQEADFGPLWLVPSHEFAARAQRVGGSTRRMLRMTASAKPTTNDQWRQFRLDNEELCSALLSALEEL